MGTTRVTVTLPSELVEEIDRIETNRSRFVLDGIRHELRRRRREELRRSLAAPHPETLEMAAEGLDSWYRGLPPEDADELLDPAAGDAVRWIEGKGWIPDEE